jgi:hypothetical protein
VCGPAAAGIQLLEELLDRVLRHAHKCVFYEFWEALHW